MSIRPSWLMVLSYFYAFADFLSVVLISVESEMLKSPTIIAEISISPSVLFVVVVVVAWCTHI